MNDVTTKQQGKMLLKAGLGPDTATMYHDTDNMGNVTLRAGKPYGKSCTPAWTAGALLELLPHTIDLYRLRIEKGGIPTWTAGYHYDDEKRLHTVTSPTLIDALVLLTMWWLGYKEVGAR